VADNTSAEGAEMKNGAEIFGAVFCGAVAIMTGMMTWFLAFALREPFAMQTPLVVMKWFAISLLGILCAVMLVMSGILARDAFRSKEPK
jgi:hypothetical protein